MPPRLAAASLAADRQGLIRVLRACIRTPPLACAELLPAPTSGQEHSEAIQFAADPPERSGIEWMHVNAMSDARHLPETVGAGCAFLDYDNDGWMDLYCVNSGPSDSYEPE